MGTEPEPSAAASDPERRRTRASPGDRPDLIEQAVRVLDGNWTGSSTIPAAGLYPHQWNWDTGFIAIGRSHVDQARAETEMLSLFDAQWRTGLLPHIAFNPDVPTGAYFPGPDFWRSTESPDAPPGRATSGITQPPVHGFAALEMHRRARDAERSAGFLRRLYPGLLALHRYLRDRRAGPEGLAAIVHPWESGLDNSPAWDRAIEQVAVSPGALPPYRRSDLVNADPRDRPSDEAYDRFVYLAMLCRDAGYDDVRVRDRAPFLVEDPMFNAIWAWSAVALSEIAGIVGEDGREAAEDAERIVAALETKLWDEGHGRFLPFDARGGEPGGLMDHRSIVSFMPIVAPGLDAAKARRAVQSMERARHCTDSPCYVLPTYEFRGPGYEARRYWRGPIWINTDWLLYRGCLATGALDMANELRTSILELVAANGFREYFDPHGREAFGASRFSWTAALYVDVAMEGTGAGAV